MAKICLVTYEIHPTNRGGCGVLLHHAAELLLRQGHEVTFLLAVPAHEFERFKSKDRLEFSSAHNCHAFHLGALCDDLALRSEECPSQSVYESVRFAHALAKLAQSRVFDFVEFFEYCGVAYYALARRLFGRESAGEGHAVLGSRLHNSLGLIDGVGSTRFLDRARYHLYALEHGQLMLSEAVLTPTRAYFESYYRDRYGIDPSKVVVSQSPKLPFPRVTRRPDPASEGFSIVYVGRLYQFKGVDQLVQAGVELLLRRPHLNCTFDIIGADASESPLGHSFKAYLLSLIPAHLRGKFEFPGNLSHEQFSGRLGRALFAVFPNRFESFCYAAHEVYDAGVPLIVRDLPGWSDFFTHERNALVYDGRTEALVGAMERLIDDGSLREGLCRPYPIATEPLGEFYSKPRKLDPLVRPGATLPRVLAVVLVEAGADATPTLEALASQQHRPQRTIVLRAALTTDAADVETFWWLGRLWKAEVRDGAVAIEQRAAWVATCDSVVVLRAGDAPNAQWLKACATALANRPGLGFAGTWGARGGRTLASDLDLAPECYPFEHGQRGTRALIRTTPGLPCIELLDSVLGGLGEIGLLWNAVASVGPGVMLHEPMIQLAHDEHQPADPNILKYLLAKYGRPFEGRLALYAGLMQERVDALGSQVRTLAARANMPLPEPSAVDPPLEHKIRVADELGGKTLARLAFKKLTRKISGNKPTG